MPKKIFYPPGERRFRALCRWSGECESPLCPLDPDLEQKSPPKFTPCCYYYLEATTPDVTFKVPSHILDKLLRYVDHLITLQGLHRDLIKKHTGAHENTTRIDDLEVGKGVV